MNTKEIKLPPMPLAFFDEFGNGADDRVQDYAREAVRLNMPPGWKLVPVEATDEMVKVGDQKTWVFPSRECWAAMLSAAPAAPQPAQQERKPLTESAIQQIGLAMPAMLHPGWLIEFARAIERAHGITED